MNWMYVILGVLIYFLGAVGTSYILSDKDGDLYDRMGYVAFWPFWLVVCILISPFVLFLVAAGGAAMLGGYLKKKHN